MTAHRFVVAAVGARYPDLDVEQSVLAPVSPVLVRDPGGSREGILRVARDADVILCGSRPVLDSAVIGELTACKGIVRYGIGVDNVDLTAAARKRIYVARVSDYGTEAVALHAVTMALAVMRRVTRADAQVKRGDWNLAELGDLHLPGHTTIGVVGLGRIGRAVADMFLRLGFHVRGHDVAGVAMPPGVDAAASLDDLLEASDVVSLHLPGSVDGKPLLTGERLRHMRVGSAVVNTSRGSLIDAEALVTGLRHGRPQFAALDVFPTEPPQLDGFGPVSEQMIMSPHMAWYTVETEIELRRSAAREALHILSGRPPRDVVVGEAEWV